MEGWLEKQGPAEKGWKRRWFALHDSVLLYYRQATVLPVCVIIFIIISLRFSISPSICLNVSQSVRLSGLLTGSYLCRPT